VHGIIQQLCIFYCTLIHAKGVMCKAHFGESCRFNFVDIPQCIVGVLGTRQETGSKKAFSFS
jgi:hypothetical protein